MLFGSLNAQAGQYHSNLSTPDGRGPFPVVILSHGRGGMKPAYDSWAEKIVSWGFAALVVDHYFNREFGFGKGYPRPFEAVDIRKEDLVSALKEIKSNKKLDISRITLAGWSAGAGLVLSGIIDDGPRKKAGLEIPIKAAVLFYPHSWACSPRSNYPDGSANSHLLILYGSNDGGLTCWKDRAIQLKSKMHSHIFKIYEGAYHIFDFSHASNKKCRTIRGRTPYELCLLYHEEAHQKSIADLKAFLMKYAR